MLSMTLQLNTLIEESHYYPNPVVNLSHYGITPIMSLCFEQDIHRNIETSVPLLREKKVQWFFDWQGEQTISTLFLKLGNAGRINHCRLELSLWKKPFDNQMLIESATLDGTIVKDNQWTQFVFKQPIEPGKYLCQLESPDADNAVNTLFVWLTNVKKSEVLIPENLFESYYYGLIPIMSLSSKPTNCREIEKIVPLSHEGKILRWAFEWRGGEPMSRLYLRLGTGGRINRCQLVLSIFQEHQQRLVAMAHRDGALVQDSQWTEFILDRHLEQGNYLCQLQSPDTDIDVQIHNFTKNLGGLTPNIYSTDNVLFIWLTAAKPELARLEPSPLIQDLSYEGLTPVLKLSLRQRYFKNIETAIPLLHDKIVQWRVNWQTKKIISAIFLKLGTGSRVNQCQLVLSILQEKSDHQKTLVATAHRDGSTIQDNEWTQFVLDHPIKPGNYTCQLHSPDTDNTNSVLFLGLTGVKEGLVNYDYVTPFSLSLSAKLDRLRQFPTISVIVLIFGGDNPSHLRDCLDSVVNQAYPHWELCIIAQRYRINEKLLAEYHRLFPHKIKSISGELAQTASELYNKALEWVTGKYTVLLHPNDLLSEDALLEVVKWIEQSVDTIDMLYSDEDKVNERGIFDDPCFKPDWAADMLKGYKYTGQLSVYRTSLLKKIGGFREELYDQAVWDMTLRLTEQTHRIQHIPKILYHRRRQPPVPFNKTLQLKMVQEALNREGYGGRVTPNTINTCLVHYPVKGKPLVSIIIPTRDMASMLYRCIEAICTITTYPNWEIIIVDNGSIETETFALFEKYRTELGTAFTVSRHDKPFNFSELVNQGVNTAKGDIILLLNNDTEILGTPDWLQEMIGFAQHSEIACVGCKLLYPQDNTIQHTGLICGIGGIANHSHKHFPAESRGYFNRLAIVANYSAITGACLMVERALWDQVNGFDENLAIAFNDVDFCLKLLKNSLRHVVLPQVTFYHYESKTRGLEDSTAKQVRLSQEEAYMKQRWGALLQNDSFYNPHLTKRSEDFSLSQGSIYYCRS
jgi:GT2 family glycosyltransferase